VEGVGDLARPRLAVGVGALVQVLDQAGLEPVLDPLELDLHRGPGAGRGRGRGPAGRAPGLRLVGALGDARGVGALLLLDPVEEGHQRPASPAEVVPGGRGTKVSPVVAGRATESGAPGRAPLVAGISYSPNAGRTVPCGLSCPRVRPSPSPASSGSALPPAPGSAGWSRIRAGRWRMCCPV